MIIGISGKKGSGKTTVAEIIKKYSKKTTEILNFADPLKLGCIYMFNLEPNQVWVHKEQKDIWWDVPIRKILQVVGTELMREHLPKYIPEMDKVWIRMMEKKIQNSHANLIVVGDVRFLDEHELIKKLGGIVLRVERLQKDHQDEHTSENTDFPYDFLVRNDGDIRDLETTVSNLEFMDLYHEQKKDVCFYLL